MRKTTFVFPEPTPLTTTDRYNIASTVATQARGNFLTAALDLENSARDLDGVLADLELEIDTLIELRANVEYDRASYLASAEALKAIVEPTQLVLF
jgi:hypothetical protein